MKRVMIALAACVSLAAVSPAGAQQPAAVSQLDVNAIPRLNSDGVRRVQMLLRQKGFDPVKIDGVLGPLTRGAVRSFQEKYGMRLRARWTTSSCSGSAPWTSPERTNSRAIRRPLPICRRARPENDPAKWTEMIMLHQQPQA
jgi:hypothetical protein